MRFYEYEAKALFARHGTPLLRGRVARTAAEAAEIARDLAVPVVLKSQVLTGGRMKAGGVKFADTPDAAEAAARAILALEIRGQRPRGVLVEERAPVVHEYFTAVTWDGRRKLPVLLDVDAAHVAEDEDGELPPPVPGDRGEVLVDDRRALLDQHAPRPLPLDLEREDRARGGLGRVRRVGELDAARLHAAAGQHLGLEHDRDGEVAGDPGGLGGGARDAAPEERRAVAGEEGLGFVFVETHRPREAANTLRR